jgi:CRP-like cAMP-binding protein
VLPRHEGALDGPRGQRPPRPAHPKVREHRPASDAEKRAIAALPVTLRDLKADEDIVREQDRPSQCCVLLEGFACRYKVMPGGRRQISSFHIPGDIPDLQSIHLQIMDHSLGTMVASKAAFISHDKIRAFIRAHPRIGDVLWRDTLIDAAIFREWVANVGRREAYQRLAHLLCEVYVRLKAVGLTKGQAYTMPVTQAELADATGLSTVHVNRTLQELRGDGLISTPKNNRVVIEDWEGLQKAGEFDPTYLHIEKLAAREVLDAGPP